LQVGQGQAEGGVHVLVGLGGDLLVEEFQLRRLRGLLQGLRGPGVPWGRRRAVAGWPGRCRSAAQAVVQAHGLGFTVDRQLALLQGVHQLDARRVGLRGPVLEQLGLLRGLAARKSSASPACVPKGSNSSNARK
jgi:hypothetical protein